MGGVTSTQNTVCEVCNSKTNQSFEQEEIKNFSFFQSVLGIKSRRGKVGGVPATVNFAGKCFITSLNERGLPKSPLVFTDHDQNGRKSYCIIAHKTKMKGKQKEIEDRIPNIRWLEQNLETIAPPEVVIEIPSDLNRKSLRRLAAKVAYERWGQLRNSDFLNDEQYENIVNFILAGSETKQICGLLCDKSLLNGMLKFHVGHHGVVIVAHPLSRVLGAFVTFYSLFYFWIILSENYPAISPFDDALIEYPQKQRTHEPVLRKKTGNLLVDWNQIMTPFLTDPISANNFSIIYAIEKFEKFMDPHNDKSP
jgi:hypothetical protein